MSDQRRIRQWREVVARTPGLTDTARAVGLTVDTAHGDVNELRITRQLGITARDLYFALDELQNADLINQKSDGFVVCGHYWRSVRHRYHDLGNDPRSDRHAQHQPTA